MGPVEVVLHLAHRWAAAEVSAIDTYDIVMAVPGLPFDGQTLERKSLGGSETAAACMARALQRLGHRVTVFSNTPEASEHEGVVYRPLADWMAYATSVPHDISIIQREPKLLAQRLVSRLNLLWCHDLALGRTAPPFRGVQWNVDKVLVLSQFMSEQYQEVYGVPPEALWVTRNGIELDRFRRISVEPIPRDRKLLICAARPERGLDVLLRDIFPALLRRDPELRLALCGYENPVEHLQPFYSEINALMRALGDRVVWLGHLIKDDLYRAYLGAGVYVYPTPSPIAPAFAEISCISAMEAQAAGLPIVTSRRGALPETVAPDAGTLIEGEPTSAEYQARFVEAVLRYVHDDEAWQRASEAGRQRAQSLDWQGVAEEWTEGFARLLAERNDSPTRLVRHFIVRSDIIAARKALEGVSGDDAQALRAYLDAGWGFASSQDGLRDQYEKIGQTHREVVFDQVPLEPRLQMLVQWLRNHPEAQKILDFGCAHGAYAIHAANQVGRTWVGVDIDRHSIALAEKWRVERANNPDSLRFIVGGADVDLSGEAPFDVLWLGEVLEHLPEPWEALNALERWVKPGGKVLATVPYGPWEHLSYQTYPHRAHLWEFDSHDLRDMLGGKKDLSVRAWPYTKHQDLQEPLGWHVIEYTVDHDRPARPIDIERKLRLQRPRETVSALLIAGGSSAEDTLHWCLKSLRPVADEIVIGDTGMTDEARRIAAQYGARLVPAPKPQEAGFDAARNAALEHCRMDWVLWLDTDEKLVDAHNIHKYLRRNWFNGYSIRQHHFACDTTFKPDLPVRLFRRVPEMRWFGNVHEHPELGLNKGPGPTIVISDVHIAHVGYLSEYVRRQRFMRNLPLLVKDMQTYPDRLLQKYFICRDNMILVMYELQGNGGQITSTVKARCEEVIRLWREHFRGRNGYLGVDALQYYSDACRVLGLGAEVVLPALNGEPALVAGRDGSLPQQVGTTTFRFANAEDLEAELAARARDALAPYASMYW